jgi:hypothetical protein
MEFTPGAASAPSEIYLPLDRHYPDGVRIVYQEMVLSLAANGTNNFHVTANPHGLDATVFQWDAVTQRMRVHAWPGSAEKTLLRVLPGARE